jgi:peptidoglycan/xylan/chitin deacetylase (PgdA/CDA1 family)
MRFKFVGVVVALACIAVVWGSARHEIAADGGVTPTATVHGQRVLLQGKRPTVASVLRTAGLRPPPGRRYSVVSHRLITDRDRTIAPAMLVDGHRAVDSTPVDPGDRIEVRSGSAVEPTVVRSVKLVAAGPTPDTSGLPDVERTLWHPVSASVQAQQVGALSGEVVSTWQVTAATPAQPEAGKVVALSFDDGPNPTWTPQVLRILGAERVPATFCDVGRWASAYPALVRAEVAQGETICDHTVDHDTSLDHDPHARVAFEVGQGADLVAAAAGVRPRFYRPPAGILSPDVIATAHSAGLRVLTWSIDPSDYLVPPPDVLLSRILSQVRPGAVILLHDGGGFRANTVGMLAQLIDTLKAEGYRFTTPAQATPA